LHDIETEKASEEAGNWDEFASLDLAGASAGCGNLSPASSLEARDRARRAQMKARMEGQSAPKRNPHAVFTLFSRCFHAVFTLFSRCCRNPFPCFNAISTPFQRHFNAISTPFQRHFNAISTPF